LPTTDYRLPRPGNACATHHLVALRKKLKKLVPYWLTSQHEQVCVTCDAPHAYAVEVRCVACDEANCPFCIVVVAGEPFCPACHDEGRPSRWRREQSGRA
ncbi:MAG: hypothetical protein ACTHQM_24200, partial [Thermoanaerobaculia bacterium]